LDVVELLDVCRALGITLSDFARRLEALIATHKGARAVNRGGGMAK